MKVSRLCRARHRNLEKVVPRRRVCNADTGRSRMARWLTSLGRIGTLLTMAGPALAADIPEACNSHQAAVAGGPLPPPASDTVVVRWLANANYEFAYKGKVYLFDAYFDR